MAINFKDPRFQEALLEMQARNTLGSGQGLMNTGALTEQFTRNQTQRQLQFQQLALQKHVAESQLALGQEQLAFKQKMFGQQMESAEDQRLFGLIGGGLSSLFAFSEGRRRKKEQGITNKLQQDLLSSLTAKIKGQ
jgi:hypothetical protein